MDRKVLESFLAQYGEINTIRDIGTIFSELGDQWNNSGDQYIGSSLNGCSILLEGVANRLTEVERGYVASLPPDQQETTISNSLEKELQELNEYFLSLGGFWGALKAFIFDNKNIMRKVERYEILQKRLDKDDEK